MDISILQNRHEWGTLGDLHKQAERPDPNLPVSQSSMSRGQNKQLEGDGRTRDCVDSLNGILDLQVWLLVFEHERLQSECGKLTKTEYPVGARGWLSHSLGLDDKIAEDSLSAPWAWVFLSLLTSCDEE